VLSQKHIFSSGIHLKFYRQVEQSFGRTYVTFSVEVTVSVSVTVVVVVVVIVVEASASVTVSVSVSVPVSVVVCADAVIVKVDFALMVIGQGTRISTSYSPCQSQQTVASYCSRKPRVEHTTLQTTFPG